MSSIAKGETRDGHGEKRNQKDFLAMWENIQQLENFRDRRLRKTRTWTLVLGGNWAAEKWAKVVTRVRLSSPQECNDLETVAVSPPPRGEDDDGKGG